MRAICCALISFIFYYIANNMNRKNKSICGMFICCSLLSLIVSIVLMVLGL